jgi:hypothetical protein
MVVMLLSYPFPGIVIRAMASMQKDVMKATDARIQTVSESKDARLPSPSFVDLCRASDGRSTDGQDFWLGAKNER